jgi:hypothetical protein
MNQRYTSSHKTQRHAHKEGCHGTLESRGRSPSLKPPRQLLQHTYLHIPTHTALQLRFLQQQADQADKSLSCCPCTMFTMSPQLAAVSKLAYAVPVHP